MFIFNLLALVAAWEKMSRQQKPAKPTQNCLYMPRQCPQDNSHCRQPFPHCLDFVPLWCRLNYRRAHLNSQQSPPIQRSEKHDFESICKSIKSWKKCSRVCWYKDGKVRWVSGWFKLHLRRDYFAGRVTKRDLPHCYCAWLRYIVW